MDEIQPLIGSAPPGNGLPGPFHPLGLVRLGPDTVRPQPAHGYDPARPIRCFSHTHSSGTGGAGRYGNIALTPFTGNRPPPDGFAKRGEEAGCGFYRVTLDPGDIAVELAAAPRAGLTQFAFPPYVPPRLLLDLGAVIQVGNRLPVRETGGSVDGLLRRVAPHAWQGFGVYQGGWGHNDPYTIHFHAEFRPAPVRAWNPADGAALPDTCRGPDLAVALEFPAGAPVTCAVGISLVSAEAARANLHRDIGTRTIPDVVRETRTAWDGKLDRWRIEGGAPEERALFHTFLTRLLCMPTDLGVDDENPAWRSGVRQFWDHYCLWDSFRGAHGFLALVEPELERDMLNAMVDVARHTGWLPDAWIAGRHGFRQGGCPAAILLAAVHRMGLSGVDYPAALDAMIADAETAPSDPDRTGRRDSAGYRARGRVALCERACVSRTLEYAWHDAAIASLARALGRIELAAQYDAFAARIWTLWRDDLQVLAPRGDDGAWIADYDPARHTREPIWEDPYFYEGLGLDWTASLVFDLDGWRTRCGGVAGLEAWLDRYWTQRRHWKEIQLHIPWLYIEAGRPDKASAAVARMRDSQYQASVDGLHDNEDMGAHAAFYLGASLGLYPCPGHDMWWLTTPRFPRCRLTLGETGRTLCIETDGPLGPGARIASASLDGVPLNSARVPHARLAAGGELRLRTTEDESAWGRFL